MLDSKDTLPGFASSSNMVQSQRVRLQREQSNSGHSTGKVQGVARTAQTVEVA